MRNRNRNTRLSILAVATAVTLAACGGGGGFEDTNDPSEQSSADGPVTLNMLIASSGDAETAAVEAATEAWAKETGNKVNVTVASDMAQELAQGFAGGSPADIFYVDAAAFPNFAAAGNLYPYGEQLSEPEDFYEPLRETFTYDDQFYCAPKDFSTLALQIDTKAWSDAGLTDADIPTTWDELSTVAQKLTTDDRVGLVLTSGSTIDRAGAFVVQSGGWWFNEDNTEATAGEPEVEEALAYIQQNMRDGSFAFASQLDSGWGGEAFGTGKAAMTIEGNWIKGAMGADYPDVDFTTVELPEGPSGKGTLQFTQCWGVASASEAQAQALDLIEALTTVEQQLSFADAFGVMPSRESAAADYQAKYPEDNAFIVGGDYGHGPISAPGMEQVIADLNSKLESLGDADVASLLEDFDTNANSVLGQ